MSRNTDPFTQTETAPKRHNRGFFTVLMICLIAVGGVAATTFSDSLKQPPTDPVSDVTPSNVTTTATTVVTTTTAKPVAVKPATTTTVETVTTATAKEANDAVLLFRLPLSNKVLTPYSEQPLYYKTLDTYRTHTAIDFEGEEGQSVKPFADGTVSLVEDDPLWGGCVTLDHGEGVISVYRGISASVKVGDELTVDDVLGKLDDIPCESDLGPHLHFELYKDGTVADASVLFDELKQ